MYDINNLTFRYMLSDRYSLEQVSLKIKKGKITLIAGPSGSGKTTLLRHLKKELLPKGKRSGKVLYDTVWHEIASGLENLRMPYEQMKRTVAEIVNYFDLQKIYHEDTDKLSGGQKQLVNLAAVMAMHPKVLILDEPTSYLDVKYKLEFLSILQEMKHQKKLTVIMSLHELDLAERISDQILCVNGTTPERFGTPQEIFTKGYISTLFGISSGSFDEKTMNAELPKPCGKPSVFVIAGDGTGRNIYRKLQRKNIPFATGILFENDLDYPVAKALAANVIASKSFEPIKGKTLEVAKATLSECDHVICCRSHFGTFEKANEELLSYAKQLGNKPIDMVVYQC